MQGQGQGGAGASKGELQVWAKTVWGRGGCDGSWWARLAILLPPTAVPVAFTLGHAKLFPSPLFPPSLLPPSPLCSGQQDAALLPPGSL